MSTQLKVNDVVGSGHEYYSMDVDVIDSADRAKYGDLGTIVTNGATLTLTKIGYDTANAQYKLTYSLSNLVDTDTLTDAFGRVFSVDDLTATTSINPTFFVDPDIINTAGYATLLPTGIDVTTQANQVSALRDIFNNTVWGLKMSADGTTFYFEKDARYSVNYTPDAEAGAGKISE